VAETQPDLAIDPHLFLVGMMGSGKSTVGPILAKRLSMRWVDLDSLVERLTGSSIAEIWRTLGEEKFRMLEAEAVETLGTPGAVVGCGGGIVKNKTVRDRLRALGRCVYLRASPSTLATRLWNSDLGALSERPLLSGIDSKADLQSRLEGILSEREDLYEGCAHLVVETDGCTPEQAAEIIADWWSQL
jgi:shikimate kinase